MAKTILWKKVRPHLSPQIHADVRSQSRPLRQSDRFRLIQRN